MQYKPILIFVAILGGMVVVAGCDRLVASKPAFKTEYQAVFLDNGQVFFGKLENESAPYPLLRDVFYVQSRVNRETKEVSNILLKRGQEWHGPDLMYINAKHIVIIEPVSPASRVSRLIKEAREK